MGGEPADCRHPLADVLAAGNTTLMDSHDAVRLSKNQSVGSNLVGSRGRVGRSGVCGTATLAPGCVRSGMSANPFTEAPGEWRAAVREVTRLNWENANARAALRCLPGFVVLLLAGLVTGELLDSAIAAAAALSVGFGSFQVLRKSRARVMLLVTGAMTVAAFSGSIASRSFWGALTAGVGFAFMYGLLSALENGIAWVALQCVIIALVTAGFPVGPRDALVRAGLTLGGGLLQTALILGIWRILGPPRDAASGPMISFGLEPAASWRETLRQHISPRSPVGRFAIQLCLTLVIAGAIYHWLNLPNGYWVPMTAVILLRPEFHQTLARGLGRLAGTLLGVGLATLLVVIVQPHTVALVVLICVFAWGSFAFLRVNYGLFAICITAYVVFLLAYMGLPEGRVVEYRLINTALGGVIALGISLLPLGRFFGSGGREEEVTEG